jgi:hypothetical protein
MFFHISSTSATTMTTSTTMSPEEMITVEQIYSYSDGTVYMGHMRTTTVEERHIPTTLSHLRHGPGTLRTPAFVYGAPLKEYTSEDAVEYAHLAKWHEYIGTWENDKMHGYGVHLQKSGDGSEIIIFEGEWRHGKPVKSIHASLSGDDEDVCDDDTVFG